MGRIKLNLRSLSVPGKIAKGRQILATLEENEDFPHPTPPLPVVKTAIDELDVAYAELQAARQMVKTKTSIQSQKEEIADQLLTQLAANVESVAGSDEKLIHSAGLDTKSRPSASTLPGQPQDLSPAAGKHAGEVDLSWDPVSGAKSYVIDSGLDPNGTNWTHAGVSTKGRKTIGNLTSGTRYWFRVAAIGAGGQSGWSDPATIIAP